MLLTYGENEVITCILRRLLNTSRNRNIYIYEVNIDFNDLYLNECIKEVEENKIYSNEIICLYKCKNNCESVNRIVNKYKNDNSIICINEENIKEGYSLKYINSNRRVTLEGKFFNIDKVKENDDFKVLAIIHVFNEEDVIGETINYLLHQGLDVYIVDNWSTDNTSIIVEEYLNDNPKHVFYERYPFNHPNDYFDWYHQLERTEEICLELKYDWYVHYDADEMRVAPWSNTTLKKAIYYADLMGCNLIENTVIDFKITEINDESIFMKDTWFEFGCREAHFLQTKTWKKNSSIDLKSSGGHLAIIDEPRLFPLKILNRHYPFRSLNQAERKVFVERKPRFTKEQQQRGWHKHYDNIKKIIDLVQDKDKLILWSADTNEELYIPLFTGAGIKKKYDAIETLSIDIKKNSRIVVYAAGKIGEKVYKRLCHNYVITHWVDKDYKRKGAIYGRIIESPKCLINNDNYEYIIVAIKDKSIARSVGNELLKWGIGKKKLIYMD